ncbi:uncharacterized protein LOC117556022 [Gymnodraco acuticeps]|uniref:Uncharacterized protein LOC117556022 n=1 Tax=Gymnodraco acuticeps TaxID=8218 RepID=A0A6P8VNK3_GYMAC|nr:uncharacterized protein LOC117556022 [Gymnodraco acuticeps]
MQTDRSRQQVPQVPESEEMSSSPPTEPEPSSPQREEDQHLEDHHGAIDSNSMTSTTANISQSPIQLYSIYLLNVLAANLIPNDSLFNFSNLNRRQISFTLAYIKHYMDNIEQQTNVPDKKLYTKFMKFFSKIQPGFSIDAALDGRPWPSFLKHRLKDHHNQYAYAEVLMKNGERIQTKLVYPVHRNNSASSTKLTKHSEEMLLEVINRLLKKYGIKVRNIFIYTYYSPCLKRGNTYCNCMTQLYQNAYQWYRKFGIVTVVYFSEPWGLRGPDIFKEFSYSDISSTSSALYPYVDQKIHFTLDIKKLKQKNRAIIPQIKMFKDDRDVQIAFKSAHSALCGLANSSEGFLKSQHLDRGSECIDSLKFPPEFPDTIIATLRENWIELVNYCSMSPIIKQLASDFNNAVVKLFISDLRSFLGNSGFFQIYQVPPGAEVEEGDYV